MGQQLRRMANFTPEEEDEIARAFNICDNNNDGMLSTGELKLYLFGLGCNLSKAQMVEISSMGNQNEEQAKRTFEQYRDQELVTIDTINSVFRTWDSNSDGTVPFDTIMAPVNDGNDM